jgi:hypothetical protein
MSPSTISSTRPPEPSSDLLSWVLLGGTAYAVYVILHTAYRIRMGAINDFGLVIHEFDPWVRTGQWASSCAPDMARRTVQAPLPTGFVRVKLIMNGTA